MTNGILGIIACPMLEDELLYGIAHDPEPKEIFMLDNEPADSIRGKMDRKKIPYTLVPRDDFYAGKADVGTNGYRVVIDMNHLGLHAEPKDLKKFIEDQITALQPHVAAVGLYYGLCGNYGWNITGWCQERHYKPAEMFRDRTGRVCDDCIGVCVGGGERYLDLEKTHTGKLYVTPAVAGNWEEFIGDMDFMKGVDNMTPQTLASMGINGGREGFMRWMFEFCGYTTLLQIDTGLEEDKKKFDAETAVVSDKMNLKIQKAEPAWPTLQPTVDLYNRCKKLLAT
ncbi:MAG: DUF1638 domain-containing protein [Candidatus Methanomethylophilus sp.]|nr:DUF1638 domain-containing protein [Methanomethylophilus sp.]